MAMSGFWLVLSLMVAVVAEKETEAVLVLPPASWTCGCPQQRSAWWAVSLEGMAHLALRNGKWSPCRNRVGRAGSSRPGGWLASLFGTPLK